MRSGASGKDPGTGLGLPLARRLAASLAALIPAVGLIPLGTRLRGRLSGQAFDAAVLALLPTERPVKLGDEEYLGVLVPSAPVPFGGALIYVPRDWVEPAPGYVDDLISVYVSMGITPPREEDPTTKAPPVGGSA